MLKKIKKCLSLLLVFCMIFSMTAMSVYADEIWPETTPESEMNTGVSAPESSEETTQEGNEDEVIPESVGKEVTSEESETSDNIADEQLPEESLALNETDNQASEPVTVAAVRSARDISADDFYKVVHVDAGRKYFSPENLKKIIDAAAEAGYNQVEIYLSDNQGFRLALDDMNVTTSTGNTYNLAPSLGDGYSDGSKAPDGSGKYLTQSEMSEIIAYAVNKNIEIVPCINVPGHMGAILENFSQFCYNGSKSSIDLTNNEAVSFALAITEKYAAYFESQGVKFYNIGADEYANDLSTMGFEGLYNSGQYQLFVDFINNAAQIVINHKMTPRAFNDGMYYYNDTSVNINKAIQVYYWSSGWGGYNVASALTIAAQGHAMINAHGDYYWVLGNSQWQCSADKAGQFSYKNFQGGTIENPAGAMFCIWCDKGNADGTDDGANVVSQTADVIKAFGETLPGSNKDDTEEKTVTCAEGSVSVTAQGLTSLECSEAEAPEIEGAENIKAYDMQPMAGQTAYADKAVVAVKVPDGWNTEKLGAFVVESDGTVTKITGTYSAADGVYSYEVPHFSVNGIYDAAPTENVLVTNNKTMTVVVGQTATDTIEGANYAGSYTAEDENIAAVAVTGADGSPATETYTVDNSVTCNNLLSKNSTSWVAAKYYYQTEGAYYPVYVRRSSSSSWWSTTYTYDYGYSKDGGNNIEEISTQKTNDVNTRANITLYTKSGNAATPASTTVTFTGKAAGTTYVTVGNTRYTINVVEEDLSKKSLEVEYWITNRRVTANGAVTGMIAANAANVYSEKGAKFSELVPATGTHENNVMVLWKGTRLAYDNKQTDASGVDKTKSGTDFNYIRYWNGAWAYSADGQAWTNVENGDQIVAYYLQKTEVTSEVETQVVDWGVVPSTEYNSGNYVLVDFAVKYESGELTPNQFPTNNTMGFHCETSTYSGGTRYRTIGMIRAEETADYEVYMITLTPTSDERTQGVANNAQYATSYEYNGTEKVIWVDDEANLGDFAAESLHYTSITGNYNYSVGGEPIVPGLEIYNQHGMRVTYYVRAKVTEDSLTVHYIDKTANQEFYNYNIAVASGTVFDENIGLATPWKGNLVNGSVTNVQGKTQNVSADLSTMPAIGAQYRYSDYTCETVERSNDGKEIYLYYTFDNTHSYVVDFGLPLTVSMTELGISGEWTSASVSGAKYGTASANISDGVTYTPNRVLKGIETLQLTLTGAGETITHQIYIYPATTVYYEEGFATFTGFSGGSKGNGSQATEKAGEKTNVYGQDGKYAAEGAGASNGTCAVSTTIGDTAQFDFAGTGVDIYTNNDTSTGSVMVLVKNGNATVKLVQVDTVMKDGKNDVTQGQAVTAYNVPIISLDLGAHGRYSVKLTHVKNGANPEGAVKFDGFRVYNTLDSTADETYGKDGESNPKFVELRDSVLYVGLNADKDDSTMYADQIASDIMKQVYDEANSVNALVLNPTLTGATNAAVTDLIDNGPKNEIYLRKGETLMFSAASGVQNVQIGLKALNEGTTYTINNETKNISSSTDMFYAVNNGAITITNTGDGILAVTKLKVFGTAASASLNAVSEEQLTRTLVAMGYSEKTTEPQQPEISYADAVLNVSVNDADGVQLVSEVLTANGAENETHTFTAEDICAAVSELALPKGYSLAQTEYNDIQVAYGAQDSVSFSASKTVVEEPKPEPTPQPEPEPSVIDKIFGSVRNWLKKIFG